MIQLIQLKRYTRGWVLTLPSTPLPSIPCSAVLANRTRIHEALEARPEDLYQDENGSWWIQIMGKGGVERHVPVSDALKAVLDSVAVAPEIRYARNLADRSARQAITNAGKRAKVSRPVSSHDLRMTFGTVIYNQTLDLRLTQELLGHASAMTTQLYTRISETRKVEAVQKFMKGTK